MTAVISSTTRSSRCPKYDLVSRQKTWRVQHCSHPLSAFVEFLRLVRRLACACHLAPLGAAEAGQVDGVLYVSYRLCSLDPSLKTDGKDCSSFLHRICGRPITPLEYLRRLAATLRGARLSFFRAGEIVHNHLDQYAPSITNNFLGCLSLLLSPKNAVNPLQYNLFACQTSSLMCHSPAARNRAGILNFHNYNMGGGAL